MNSKLPPTTKEMPQYYLLNDTSTERHAGCSAVMAAIDEHAEQRGWTNCGRKYVGQQLNWESQQAAISIADLILVNGEGTLHHDRHVCTSLAVAIAELSRRGKRVVLINSTIHSVSDTVARLLAGSSQIYVRDQISAEVFSHLENYVVVEYCPDLILNGEWASPSDAVKGRRLQTAFTDSVRLKDTHMLWNTCIPLGATYLGVKDSNKLDVRRVSKWSMQALSKSPQDIVAYARAISGLSRRNLSSRFFSRLKEFDFLVTGRYHAVLAAIRMGVPFAYVPSNTPKIENALRDIGLNPEDRRLDFVMSIKNRKWCTSAGNEIGMFSRDEKTSIAKFSELSAKKIEEMMDNVFKI